MLKNITLSAEESLIRRAREKTAIEKTTLNAEFRIWLKKYVERPQKAEDFMAIMEQLAEVEAGKSFTRDELNER